MFRQSLAALACAAVLSATTGVLAQTTLAPANGTDEAAPGTGPDPAVPAADAPIPAPDKLGYDLFDPVPDGDLRPLETDRPTKSNSPYTVDAGHFQYEADIVNWTYDHYSYSRTTTSNVLVTDPTLKLGLTNGTDLEIALAPIDFLRTSDRSNATRGEGNGFGDVYTRVKFNLLGDDGGDYALAIVPYVKAPTAARSIGNGHWEGGGYIPFSFALPDDWTALVMTELDFQENADLSGVHQNYQNMINFSHAIGTDTNVTGYVEFYSDVDTDPGLQPVYTADLAAAWLVRPDLQLDAGTNIGLDKAAPDLQVYVGISQRF